MRNKDFSKECFYNALVDLMKEKDFDDIQINEICQKAGFNRSTFYRNYNSKMDVLMSKFKEEAKKYQQLVNDNKEKTFMYKAIKLFELLRLSYHIFIQMRKAKLDQEMYQEFSSIYPLDENLMSSKYAMTFKTGGVYMVIIEWMENGMIESDQEMAETLRDVINNCRA